ncbi:hypothetical protein BO83DRAFT_449158 [Aspergillus eucalypticola CBS 122712]|uniref:Uncharacterized protein n=1 Tax=Aspergillus eucalypticola (strain CBS 122712 / IBT 29274) TaxID=1448314 RepID=A0A317V4A2_ASPEC|nr:uncharacterized protein BO83DRAFT_449158 [Aspergillus eucalypticola CBS 122712]PWY68925.1 hypothetical protein BO83DRAFT_449158 [Aspergillus eucalypticola CBS 122712]
MRPGSCSWFLLEVVFPTKIERKAMPQISTRKDCIRRHVHCGDGSWAYHFLVGKKLKLLISFYYVDDNQGATASRRATDKQGASSATQGMLREYLK